MGCGPQTKEMQTLGPETLGAKPCNVVYQVFQVMETLPMCEN